MEEFWNFIQELRRPRRILGALGLLLFSLAWWSIKEFVEDTAFEKWRAWLEGHFDLAMRAFHFIAAHWWWIPWGLVPISIAVMLGWAIADARKTVRDRMIPVQHLEDRDLHDQAKSWLKHRLSEKTLKVKQAFLFGSVIHDHYPTSDVDLGVIVEPTTDRQLARIGRELKKKLAQDFKYTFGHSLHISFFVADEQSRLMDFLAKAGEHEPID